MTARKRVRLGKAGAGYGNVPRYRPAPPPDRTFRGRRLTWAEGWGDDGRLYLCGADTPASKTARRRRTRLGACGVALFDAEITYEWWRHWSGTIASGTTEGGHREPPQVLRFMPRLSAPRLVALGEVFIQMGMRMP